VHDSICFFACWSPAPKANDDFAKTKFCSEMAKVKNAQAFGVRCTGWLCAGQGPAAKWCYLE